MTRVTTTMLLLLLLLAGGILLQIFLSRRESKWPGLVLPMVTFLWSLVMVLNVAADSLAQAVSAILMVLILGNIPTAVLLAIYFACREKRRKRTELDKMNLSDL